MRVKEIMQRRRLFHFVGPAFGLFLIFMFLVFFPPIPLERDPGTRVGEKKEGDHPTSEKSQ